jgi:acyl-[acyl-carrier-protein]-phospholipid O-acyltransferase/long-chain-fatty-acid--[acyl-carrier-protein] ligase
LENVPVDGPALLVANHVTWADAVLMVSTMPRRIRFLMSREMYDSMPRIRWLLDLGGVIPVSKRDPGGAIENSLSEAKDQLDAGYIVCIFAEGMLSRTGMMQKFKTGFSRILKGTDHPLIPVYLGGVWGSIFSYAHGDHILSRFPAKLPYPVTIIFGQPMSPDSDRLEVRQRVQELSCEDFEDRKATCRPLPELALRTARRRWRRPALHDTTGRELTFGAAAVSAIALRRVLRRSIDCERHVGLALPASVGGSLANLAVALLGRVPVNLNISSGSASISSMIRQAGLTTVITVKPIRQKLADVDWPASVLYLDELLLQIGGKDKLAAFIAGKLLPSSWVACPRDFDADRVAAVLFSSGSTGRPKGVMLSHYNLISNIEAAGMVMQLDDSDRICGSLPLFHAFGFTCTLWLPLLLGRAVSFHPNPLETGKIADLIRDRNCTFLITTPTLLVRTMSRADPEALRSLRHCLVGAEKLKPELATQFEEVFGIQPYEGYGATELSPLTTVNIPDVETERDVHVGNKPGTVGHPIPGVAVKIVHPDTCETLGYGETGLLMIKGPNVMQGYLNDEEATTAVLKDGWYDTCDIASMDADGFITLHDRMARFSKIGGEMVPHLAVEEALLEGVEADEPVLAVTGVPDDAKGERLVVVYTDAAGPPDRLRQALSNSDVPNLWKPKPDAFVHAEAIPLLPTGKLDLAAIRRLALDF